MQIEDQHGLKIEFDTMDLPQGTKRLNDLMHEPMASITDEASIRKKILAEIEKQELLARASAIGLSFEEYIRRVESVLTEYGDPATLGKEAGVKAGQGVADGMEPQTIRVKPVKTTKRWKPAKARPR